MIERCRTRPSTRRNPSGGFTLIELMVVMAIITVLAMFLLPAIGRARRAALRAKAQVAVKDLQAAFNAYFDEYKRWPVGVASGPGAPGVSDANGPDGVNNETATTGIRMEANVVRMLRGEDINNQNPKRMTFLDLPPNMLNANGQYVDPWGSPYKYMLDYNMDNRVHIWFSNNNGQTNLNRSVAVWSPGADGSDERGRQEDDARTWQ